MNISSLSWKVKAIAAVATVVLIAAAGAGVAHWITATKYKAEIATLEKKHAEQRAAWETEKTSIATLAQQETAKALERQQAAERAAADLDEHYTGKLTDAEKTIDSLRRDVSAGKRRVRLATSAVAACQHSTGGNTETGGVGDAAGVELTAAAGRTIYDIRSGIVSDQAKLAYLQDYVKTVVNQCKR